ncbi:anthrone oxygenase family protein [Pseudofrankia inefficax]|uniref:Integral-membrane protein n=1 Tax=Pseudofrankia inefficax (strain DSM 45817 / CECT 9037 / DDB 130130 / EuI1c) TaxID=298654 RepID=E3IUD0_PSEI1|nr:anthrone oxygenase family protein [Pseudofrankia inefficax]ADP82467.1 protein of unknown function DUF1772 [Pseudofrankia inefficax]
MYTQAGGPQTLGVAGSAAGPPVVTNLVLVGATVLTGLAAGVLALYAHTVMPGLKKSDDRTFVAAFQSIDRAIINPWFMVTFFGALILTGLAGVLHLGPDRRSVLPWLVGAFALYLITVVITVAIHVPLNDAIKGAGDPNHIDVARVRAAFDETRWAAWNLVRTITATGAFVILVGVAAARHR